LLKLSVPRKHNLKVKTDLNALGEILSWFAKLYEPQIPRQIWLRCELALAEGFTNAVRHAHKNKPPEVPIDLEVTISDDTTEMRIWDSGPGFDLAAYLDKMLKPENNQTGGGRGLQLIQKTTDHFSYTRTADNRNCLLTIKSYRAENGSIQ
jgi:serine/threonine-protein kinase RsbW